MENAKGKKWNSTNKSGPGKGLKFQPVEAKEEHHAAGEPRVQNAVVSWGSASLCTERR